MQTVGSHDEIEFALASLRKFYCNAIVAFLRAVDFIAQYYFRAVPDLFDQQTRQRAARNGHIAAAGQLQKDPCPESADESAPPIDKLEFSEVVTNPIQL